MIVHPMPPVIVSPIESPIAARGSDLPWGADGTTVSVLVDQLIALLGKGTGGGWQALWPHYPPFLTLPSATPTHVSDIRDATGLGNTESQSNDAMRPIFNTASPVLGGRGVSYPAASASMVTGANIDCSAFRYVGCLALYSDTATALVGIMDFGGSINGRCTLAANNGSAGTLSVFGKAAAGDSEARSAASFAMTTAGVVCGIVDYDATTNCTTIYHNGTDVTNSRPDNSNLSASSPANNTVTLGALKGPSNNTTGAIGIAGLFAFNDAAKIAIVNGAITERIRAFYGV